MLDKIRSIIQGISCIFFGSWVISKEVSQWYSQEMSEAVGEGDCGRAITLSQIYWGIVEGR